MHIKIYKLELDLPKADSSWGVKCALLHLGDDSRSYSG